MDVRISSKTVPNVIVILYVIISMHEPKVAFSVSCYLLHIFTKWMKKALVYLLMSLELFVELKLWSQEKCLPLHISILHLYMYLLTKAESGLLQTVPTQRWNFSLTFLKKNPNKNVNNGTLQEREQAKIGDVRKRNSKLSGESSSTELGQFVVNLTRL